MVIALIAIGVIAFLVFDFWILAKVLGGQKNAGAYGSLQIPGSTQLTLQPGKLKAWYHESKKSRSDDDEILFSRPDDLQVTVTGVDGTPLELDGPGFRGMGSSKSTRKGQSRDLHGTFHITQAGLYNVQVTGTPPPDAVEPQVLLGK